MFRWLTGLIIGVVLLGAPLWEAHAAPPVPPPPVQWQWQNPLPHGNSLFAASCPTTTTCYAVGGATIGVSRTPGQWSFRIDKQWDSLVALSCPTEATCYAVSNSGTSLGAILGTKDGGATWDQLRAGGSTAVTTISCPSALVCYGTSQYAGRVVMTDDGGQTWSSKKISFRPVGLSCPTATTCYAPIDTSLINSPPLSVAVSADAGATWTLHPVGVQGQLWSIQCVSASTCYTIAFTGLDLGVPLFLKTTDGGRVWSKHAFPRDTYFRGGSFTCPTAATCYLAGDNGTMTGILLSTGNAGGSWTRRKPLSSLPFDLACRDRLSCLAVGTGGTIESTVTGWVTRVQETRNVVRSLAMSGRGFALRAVACPSPTVCYAAGDQASLVATSDAGRRWYSRAAALARSRLTGNIVTLACADTRTCFAGTTPIYPPGLQSGNEVFVTRNWGTTWSPNPGEGFVVVTCPSITVCYAGGQKGAVRVTHNAGRSWTTVKTPLSGKQYTIREMTCPTVGVCYAGAIGPSEPPPHPSSYVGAILSTTDGGRSWKRRNTDPYPIALACRTPSSCFALLAVSYNTKHLITRNSGRTWAPYSALRPADDWRSIICPDAGICYVVGRGGNVAITTDGGATWAPDGTPTFNALNSIACIARNVCYTVGDFGTILVRQPEPQSSAVIPWAAHIAVAQRQGETDRQAHGEIAVAPVWLGLP